MATEHDDTLDDARAAERRDALDQWVDAFLRSPGSDNADLADQLAERISIWHGLVRLEFDDLHRLAGPPDQPTMDRFDGDDDTIAGMVDSVRDGWEPPPVIVSLNGPQLVVEDGNHRIEALRRTGRSDHWAVVGFETESERDRFLDGRVDR